MGRRIIVALLALLAFTSPVRVAAQEARALLEQAAEAMGGLDRLQGLENVTYTGFGQRAYYQGGGNSTGDPMAPMKWQTLTDVQRTFYLHDKVAVNQERWGQQFPFAGLFGLNYGRTSRPQAGSQLLDHPLPALLSALDATTTLGTVSEENGLLVVAFTRQSAPGPAWIAIDPATHLPRFTRWVTPHANLGDLTTTAWFTGYTLVDGVRLPLGLMQNLDWRDVTNLMFQIDSYRINVPAEQLSPAPPPLAVDDTIAETAGISRIAPGVWDVRVNGAGGLVIEFADHLVMFEAYGGEVQTMNRIDAANSLVPGKQVTAVIVSHHHFDHTGGLRAAVSRGLEVISQRGNEGIIREMVERPATRFPDALARNPQPLRFTPVDEQLVLEDASRRLEIYRVIEHAHMPDAVFAYLPTERIMLEGDLGDTTWHFHFWGSAYAANIAHYGIAPERNVAVHGSGPRTIAETLEITSRQIDQAQEFCRMAEQMGRFQQGCPVQYDAEGPLALEPR